MILPAIVLLAQLELTGGASSLFNAGGGAATLYRQSDSTTLSAGVSDGRLVGGFAYRTGNWTVGDEQLILTTGNEGTAVPLRGVAYELAPSLTRTCPEAPVRRLYGVGSCMPRRWDLLVAVGLTGDAYTLPFFAGMRATRPTAGLRFSTPIGSAFHLAIVALTGRKQSLIPELDWNSRLVAAALAGGVVQGRKLLDARLALRSRRIGLAVAHENYFAPERLDLDSAGVSTSFGSWSGYASVFRSTVSGEAVGVSYRVAFVRLGAGFLASSTRVATASASEQLTRRIAVSEFLTRSGGRNTYNLGGSFRSNLVTAELGWAEYFVPQRGFERLPSISGSFQLPHSVTLNLSLVGKLWTASSGAFVGGPIGSSTPWLTPKLKDYQPVEGE